MEIRTVVEINATPARVWEVLMRFPDYPRWNPFIREVEGQPRAGETLKISISQANGKAMRFRPQVLVASPLTEFRWKGRLVLPGLFDGEHYFLLEPGGTGTVLTHGGGSAVSCPD